METLLEQIERGKLWHSPGGVHPTPFKEYSTKTAIARLAIPETLTIPLKQHIGSNGTLLVKKGDFVLKGQALTQSQAHWSVPVHAPTSGHIEDICPMPSTHPSALPELSIILAPDQQDTWCELFPWPDFHAKSSEQIVERIQQSGISGMGGAGFPTYVKAQPKQQIEYLIINGVECEPFITADDMLMREHSNELIKGIEVLRKLYQPTKVILAIEDDKPEAINALTKACEEDNNTIVRAIPTKYPSGGEKQLIQIVTSKQVPKGGIPADIGIVVHNIGTIYAIYQAIFEGKPLIERVVTITGDTITQPQNAWVLLGTQVKHLLNQCGFTPEQWQRVIMGGPMMGFTLPSVRLPIIKTSNCVLAPTEKQLPFAGEEQACIRCSACADACPASLLPQQLQWYAKSKEYDKLEEYNLFDCIECGACAYVCPSEIPLVQYYRVAKSQIKQQQAEKQSAERAKLRFEARNERLEKEKEARNNRHKRTAERATAKTNAQVTDAANRVKDNGQNAAVAAAIAKANASKSGEPDNSDMAKLRAERKAQARKYKAEKAAEEQSLDPRKAAVEAALQRAKGKKAAKEAAVNQEHSNDTNQPEIQSDPRKAAVAAAIARAKAKKGAKSEQASNEQTDASSESFVSNSSVSNSTANESDDPRKAAVAAAIARAKAKKAAQSTTEQSDAPSVNESTANESNDPRKAAVAAAIARAKAKKAAKAEQTDTAAKSAENNSTASESDDPRKASVAAAIARAKAKKVAKAEQASNEQTDASSESSVSNSTASESDDPRKAAVAAAIARAKAKKAAKAEQASNQQTDASLQSSVSNSAVNNNTASESDDPRKAAVAAAIARAKAKKAAKAEQASNKQTDASSDSAVNNSTASESDDPRKAAVAAAIARAKAKKAAKAEQASNEQTDASSQSSVSNSTVNNSAASESDDPRKAAVAAAIARAKAKKAAKEAEQQRQLGEEDE